MNVGIDLDGVLTDIQKFNLKHAPPFFRRKYSREVANEWPYDIRDIFDCPEAEYKAYWKRYLFKYVITESARKDAKNVVKKLQADGHSIYIISKRVFTCNQNLMGKIMRFIVRNWLWRNGISYSDLVFCDNDIPESKRVACVEYDIDIMIDDEAVNINAIAPIAKVICFDASYNKKCDGVNITRAKSFNEIYTIINQMFC